MWGLIAGWMPAVPDRAFAVALRSLSGQGVLIGHRTIQPGDENALMPSETPAFAGSVESVRRQSGAARIAARHVLSAFGYGDVPLPRSPSGAPSWPCGIVGSLAHDGVVALAAVAPVDQVFALGIDVEPASELPPELVDRVATPLERIRYARDLLASRLLFVIKEAVYKAMHPLDGQFIDFPDVEVDLDMQSATTRTGHRLRIAWAAAPRVVALASMSGPIPGLPDGAAVSPCRQDRKVQKLGSRPD